MNDPLSSRLEERSRELLRDSVGNLDMPTRSRLTQARHAALAVAGRGDRLRAVRWWAPAAGFSAAAMLGAALWLGPMAVDRTHTDASLRMGAPAAADTQSSLEDLDIVASADEMDLLQDDVEFYDWADKAASADPGSVG
jgi:hypothetical protein